MMKLYAAFVAFVFFVLASCSSVKVYSDFDNNADFSGYKTYAFYKKGIDKVEISDLDKKRILRAIEAQLTAKGMVKSEDPDLLVNIFTKSREKIDVYNNKYYGWYPWYYGYGFGYYGPGYGLYYPWYPTAGVSYSYTTGSIMINMIDPSRADQNAEQIPSIWVGFLNGLVADSQQNNAERISEGIDQLFEQSPYLGSR